MLLDRHIGQVLNKLRQIEITYGDLVFPVLEEVSVVYAECKEHYRKTPNLEYKPIESGQIWGGTEMSGWFKGNIQVKKEYSNMPLFLCAKTGALEGLLFVNDMPSGVYAHKSVEHNRGHHHTLLLHKGAEEGTEIPFSVEAYCWHDVVGTQPFQISDYSDKLVKFEGMTLCSQDEQVKKFVFTLRIVLQLEANVTDEFYQAQLQNTLWDAFQEISQKPYETTEEVWRAGLERAMEILEPIILRKNSPYANKVGIIGHSHIDTAWQWTIDETIRKCARTYSNVISLMDQYPNYMFLQSSSYHLEMMKLNYPELYEKIKEKIAEGRYEPNGGAWVECDCNLVNGESLIRQFIKGQTFTKEEFNYVSDTFWLPDTFGYSAALPQILKQCGIKYFLTTKLMWNDTNSFPYDTFHWKGIDGTTVFTNFNNIHCKPDPDNIIKNLHKHNVQKRVNQSRFLSFGFGDGGGGPSYDLVEMAEYTSDIYACPKAEYMTVSKYMEGLEESTRDVPIYAGELYLELHRGTLTSIHDIKKNNRLAETALHDLEFANAISYIHQGTTVDTEEVIDLLLVNQFHDILPGTSIQEVNDRSRKEMTKVIEDSKKGVQKALENQAGKVGLMNSMPFARSSSYLPLEYQHYFETTQQVDRITSGKCIYVENLELESCSIHDIMTVDSKNTLEKGEFCYTDTGFETPFYQAVFAEDGSIESLFDKRSQRAVEQENGWGLNRFILAEDIPQAWDNWDIDADVLESMKPSNFFVSRELIQMGALQMRIRSQYHLSKKSTITQDMVLYANKPDIDFETKVEWGEVHKVLKTMFDVSVHATQAKHEIQFGYLERSTEKNTSVEKAMFEVPQHKYTDLSEPKFGVALLNDCKYGISVLGSQMGLTLLKGGNHPDPRSDAGTHTFVYKMVVHNGFNFENVVKPAYELNYPIQVIEKTNYFVKSLVKSSQENIMIETIKPSEDGEAVILRAYECLGTRTNTKLSFGKKVKAAYLTNMLEEEEQVLEMIDGEIALGLRAFEIATIKLIF